jgi:hypothetical protein
MYFVETSGICGWIKDWNTVGGNQQVEELAQHHTDLGGGGGWLVSGGGRRQVNKTFSLSTNFSYKSVCPTLKGTVKGWKERLWKGACYELREWMLVINHIYNIYWKYKINLYLFIS